MRRNGQSEWNFNCKYLESFLRILLDELKEEPLGAFKSAKVILGMLRVPGALDLGYAFLHPLDLRLAINRSLIPSCKPSMNSYAMAQGPALKATGPMIFH